VILKDIERKTSQGTQYFDVAIAPVLNAKKPLLGSILTFVNKTDSKRLKDKLEYTNAELKRVSEALQATQTELESTRQERQILAEDTHKRNQSSEGTSADLHCKNQGKENNLGLTQLNQFRLQDWGLRCTHNILDWLRSKLFRPLNLP